jgi:hypothetical protein
VGARHTLRQQQAPELLKAIKGSMQAARAHALPASKLGKAISYALGLWSRASAMRRRPAADRRRLQRSRRSPSLAAFRPHQPRAQGIDAPDGPGSGFLVGPTGLGGNRHRSGLAESQIPRAGATPESADAAHILRLLVEQTGVSKIHVVGSPHA